MSGDGQVDAAPLGHCRASAARMIRHLAELDMEHGWRERAATFRALADEVERGPVVVQTSAARLPYQGQPLLGGQGDPLATGTIPRVVGEAAWQGYAACGFGAQSCERLHERGGFSLAELGYFLARAVDAGLVEIRVVGKEALCSR